VPHVLKGYKKLIDTGFGMHLPDALRYELAAGIESAKQISAATVAARREGVFARGREQSEKK
jgi:enoyl-CoA hydratase